MSTDSPLVTLDYPTSLHSGGANGRITRVVIHATVSPCVRGGAKNNARYFQSPAAGGAAHYIVDPGAIAQSVREAVKAHHAPPNQGSIGVELCDPQTGDDNRWDDPDHVAMLYLAAKLVADVCARHSLPLDWLPPAALLAGDSGITSHANVSLAWRQTDHTDPGGAFPVAHFMALVRGTPAPPTPQPQEVDKMLHLVQGDKKPEWFVTDFITKRYVGSAEEAGAIIYATGAAGGKIAHGPNNGPNILPQKYVDAITIAG